MNTIDPHLLEASEDLTNQLAAILAEPIVSSSQRIRVSALAGCVSLEHCSASRALLAFGLIPSALVVHRAQYEAVVRAVWACYAASDTQIAKLVNTLDVETEQAAKNLPTVAEMMTKLSTEAPELAYRTLANFKEHSWKPLNSFVHAGIHALQRHQTGYPVGLVEQFLRNCNGLAVVAGMQLAMLTNNQEIAKRVGALQSSHANCLPLR